MTKIDQLAVEVYFVPLPGADIEERRERLRMFLLRGAIRIVQQQVPDSPTPAVCADGELARK